MNEQKPWMSLEEYRKFEAARREAHGYLMQHWKQTGQPPKRVKSQPVSKLKRFVRQLFS